eukprot:Gb_17248 [translate_table: standard]
MLPLANGVKFVRKNAVFAHNIGFGLKLIVSAIFAHNFAVLGQVMNGFSHEAPRRIRSHLYSFLALDINSAESNNVGSSPSILSVVSSLIDRVVVRNERKSASTSQCLVSPKMGFFHGFRVVDISIEQYLERIILNLGFRITSLNVHRLLITSVMLASKFLDDLFMRTFCWALVRNYNNAYYAKVGGITTKHINSLEIEFLFMLDFRLQVTVSVFESYCAHLEREVALAGGYQIERTLRCICGMDEGSTRDDSQKEGLSFRCSSRGPYMTSVAAMRNFMEVPVAHTIFDVSHCSVLLLQEIIFWDAFNGISDDRCMEGLFMNDYQGYISSIKGHHVNQRLQRLQLLAWAWRKDGTFNRTLMNFLEYKSPPNLKPEHGVYTMMLSSTPTLGFGFVSSFLLQTRSMVQNPQTLKRKKQKIGQEMKSYSDISRLQMRSRVPILYSL